MIFACKFSPLEHFLFDLLFDAHPLLLWPLAVKFTAKHVGPSSPGKQAALRSVASSTRLVACSTSSDRGFYVFFLHVGLGIRY